MGKKGGEVVSTVRIGPSSSNSTDGKVGEKQSRRIYTRVHEFPELMYRIDIKGLIFN